MKSQRSAEMGPQTGGCHYTYREKDPETRDGALLAMVASVAPGARSMHLRSNIPVTVSRMTSVV